MQRSSLSFCHDARRNVHCLQLLKQKLACIRNLNIRKFSAIFTHVAAVYSHSFIHRCYHAATLAHEHLVFI